MVVTCSHDFYCCQGLIRPPLLIESGPNDRPIVEQSGSESRTFAPGLVRLL
jgi:hypothetical protein